MTHTGNHNQGGHVYATATLPIPQSQSVGTTHAPDVRDAPRVHRWRVVGALVLALAVAGCIPVTIRPQFDAENKPIAIPVTPTGSISPDGTLVPIYPVSDKSPQPTNWGAVGLGISAVLNALLMAYGINLRGVASKTMTALRITADLADENADAETDEQVRQNKALAQKRQEVFGVRGIVQKAREK